eukprot:8451736-Alexandrium_andersonii.AAC.1
MNNSKWTTALQAVRNGLQRFAAVSRAAVSGGRLPPHPPRTPRKSSLGGPGGRSLCRKPLQTAANRCERLQTTANWLKR